MTKCGDPSNETMLTKEGYDGRYAIIMIPSCSNAVSNIYTGIYGDIPIRVKYSGQY